MGIPPFRPSVIGALLAVLAACGSTTGAPGAAAQRASAPDCVPDENLVIEPLAGEDRRFENVEEYLTGYRLEDLPEGQEEPNADLNWGGIWGDFAGGMVVAVLDCSVVDVNEVASLAGPEGELRIIEVPYTFDEVNAFRDSFTAQLTAAAIEGDLPIELTLTGRHIEVRVRDASALPNDFGREIPEDIYSIVETDDLFSEE